MYETSDSADDFQVPKPDDSVDDFEASKPSASQTEMNKRQKQLYSDVLTSTKNTVLRMPSRCVAGGFCCFITAEKGRVAKAKERGHD